MDTTSPPPYAKPAEVQAANNGSRFRRCPAVQDFADVSPRVVILARTELAAVIDAAFGAGVDRGRFEERMAQRAEAWSYVHTAEAPL